MPPTPLSFSRHFSLDAGAVQRMKNPTRGGQNLSLRYRRLEQSLRGKEALQSDILAHESEISGGFGEGRSGGKDPDAQRYFRGFEIPQRPTPPESDECCMSGCAVCVYDLYEESAATYKEAIAAFRAKLTAAGVPEAAWPAGAQTPGLEKKSATLSAFEELEKALREKRAGKSGEPQ